MNDIINQVVTEINYRGYSSNTKQSYTSHLNRIARFLGRLLDEVSCDELNSYFQHPLVRRLSYASIALQINSLAFLYKHVLKRPLTLDVAAMAPYRALFHSANGLPHILSCFNIIAGAEKFAA